MLGLILLGVFLGLRSRSDSQTKNLIQDRLGSPVSESPLDELYEESRAEAFRSYTSQLQSERGSK